MPYVASLPGSRALIAAVAARNRRRLGELARWLKRRGHGPGAALIAEALASAAGSGDAGLAVLASSELRALGLGLAAIRRLDRVLAAALAAPGQASAPRRERAVAALFAEMARTPYLREVAPRQVPGRDFLAACARVAARMLDEACRELPLTLAGLTRRPLPGTGFALPDRADPERALARGETALAGTALVLRLRRMRRPGPGRVHVRVELAAGELHLIAGGRRLLAVPRPPRPIAGRGAAVLERPLVAGSPTLRLGRRVVSRPDGLAVGAPVPGLERKLGRALALLAAAWPDGAREVHLFTELVVPLDEPRTVSYSLASRPGVSYINTWGKSTLQLADDLLHETAHHKLHAVEELEPLAADGGLPLWWSPWRRAWRPLRGILHASYTFTYGALLFAKLARSRRARLTAAQRRFALRRLLEEEAALEFSLADLARAARQRQLTVAGSEVVRELRARFAGEIRPAAAAAERRLLGAGAQASAALGAIARRHEELARMRGRAPGE